MQLPIFIEMKVKYQSSQSSSRGFGLSHLHKKLDIKQMIDSSAKGVLSLLKIKETILNNQWNLWWEEGRKQNPKVGKFYPLLSASYFKEERKSFPLIEASIPALVGTDQDKS